MTRSTFVFLFMLSFPIDRNHKKKIIIQIFCLNILCYCISRCTQFYQVPWTLKMCSHRRKANANQNVISLWKWVSFSPSPHVNTSLLVAYVKHDMILDRSLRTCTSRLLEKYRNKQRKLNWMFFCYNETLIEQIYLCRGHKLSLQ